MKDSKFWTWFLPLLFFLVVVVFIRLNKVNTINTVKSDYEYLNNNSEIKVNIKEDKLFNYITKEDIDKLDTGVIFVGNKNDNKSRELINTLQDTVLKTSLDKVYVIDDISIINNKYNVNYELPVILFIKNKKIENVYKVNDDSKELLNYIIKLLGDVCDDEC